MQLSTQLNKLPPELRGSRTVGRRLEDVGVDLLWVGEAYGFDAVSALGFHAATTSTLRLAAGILSVYSRSAALLAQTAAGLDALSGGRFELGLGASGPQVVEGWHGVPFAQPTRRVRDAIEICRMVWSGSALRHEGIVSLPGADAEGQERPALRLLDRPARTRVPVWVAALGPSTVALTAEQAYGWLPILFWPERSAGVFGSAIASGKSKRDADLGELAVAAGGYVDLTSGSTAGTAEARRDLARFVGGMGSRSTNFYASLARRYGLETEASRIQELYLSGRREEAAAAVPEALVAGTNLLGDADHVRRRIDAYREAGVTVLNVVPSGTDDPIRTLARVKQLIE